MPKRILVIDDAPVPRTVLVRALENWGFDLEIVEATSRQDAEDRLVTRGEKFDIIILDVQLRPTNKDRADLKQYANVGLDFYEQYVSYFKNSHVICITYYSKTGQEKRAKRLGIPYFFYRKIKDEELLSTMASLIRESP